jgi:hypothetical protein
MVTRQVKCNTGPLLCDALPTPETAKICLVEIAMQNSILSLIRLSASNQWQHSRKRMHVVPTSCPVLQSMDKTASIRLQSFRALEFFFLYSIQACSPSYSFAYTLHCKIHAKPLLHKLFGFIFFEPCPHGNHSNIFLCPT